MGTCDFSKTCFSNSRVKMENKCFQAYWPIVVGLFGKKFPTTKSDSRDFLLTTPILFIGRVLQKLNNYSHTQHCKHTHLVLSHTYEVVSHVEFYTFLLHLLELHLCVVFF